MNKKVSFTVAVTMDEGWVNHFLSMLARMENLGVNGSSRLTSIYSDGDGDFQPKFVPDIEFEIVPPVKDNGGDYTYDAG